jgi:hypothetical protein
LVFWKFFIRLSKTVAILSFSCNTVGFYKKKPPKPPTDQKAGSPGLSRFGSVLVWSGVVGVVGVQSKAQTK